MYRTRTATKTEVKVVNESEFVQIPNCLIQVAGPASLPGPQQIKHVLTKFEKDAHKLITLSSSLL